MQNKHDGVVLPEVPRLTGEKWLWCSTKGRGVAWPREQYPRGNKAYGYTDGQNFCFDVLLPVCPRGAVG